MRHDLLNDFGREKVMADITGWIDARLPDTTSASGGLREVTAS